MIRVTQSRKLGEPFFLPFPQVAWGGMTVTSSVPWEARYEAG